MLPLLVVNKGSHKTDNLHRELLQCTKIWLKSNALSCVLKYVHMEHIQLVICSITGLGTGYPVANTQVPGPSLKFHLT